MLKTALASLLLAGGLLAQTQVNISQRQLRATGVTVATLPGTPRTGEIAVITDGASGTDCTTGSGSAIVVCRYNGSAWASMGGGLLTVDVSDDTNLAVSAPIVLTDDTVSFNNDDLALTGDPTLTDAASPSFTITDSTTPTTLKAQVSDLSGTFGTTTAHHLTLLSGGANALQLQTDGDVVFGDGLAASYTATFQNTGTAPIFSVSTGVLNLSQGTLQQGGNAVAYETGSPTFTAVDSGYFASTAADPADAGAIRLGNTECVAWELATPGTDSTFCLDSNNQLTMTLPNSVTLNFGVGVGTNQFTVTSATNTRFYLDTGTTGWTFNAHKDSGELRITEDASGTPQAIFEADGDLYIEGALTFGDGAAFMYPPAATEPANCTTANDGSMYFDTSDQKLCVCVNDGTDDEWVFTDDYSHATGHCSTT